MCCLVSLSDCGDIGSLDGFMTDVSLIIAESPLQAKRKLSAPLTFPVTPKTQIEVIAGRKPIVADDPAEHPLHRLHQFAISVLRSRDRFCLQLHNYLLTHLAATLRSTPSTVFLSSDSRSQSVIASSQCFGRPAKSTTATLRRSQDKRYSGLLSCYS